jgi:hypothetical protein
VTGVDEHDLVDAGAGAATPEWLRDWARDLVATFPPLTCDQLDEIRRTLTPFVHDLPVDGCDDSDTAGDDVSCRVADMRAA